MGQTLANYSYVNLSEVGSDPSGSDSGSDSVQCITDLQTCCSHSQGPHRGDWYFPDGTRLPFSGGGDIFESRGPQRVALHHRNNADSPSGVYRCRNAVHGHYYNSERESVFVGLYRNNRSLLVIIGRMFLQEISQYLEE